MATFNKYAKKILLVEGGYVFDKDDPGGETKFGISKRTYPNLDIKHLTEEDALKIYEKDWWNKYNFFQINDELLAYKVFEFAVNAGYSRAARAIQQSLNVLGTKVEVDGKIGPITMGYINSSDPVKLLESFRASMINYYTGLTKNNPKLSKFLKGWINRANS